MSFATTFSLIHI